MNTLYFDEELVQQLYLKRKQLLKLQLEVEQMNKFIKDSMINNHMLYSATKHFNLHLDVKNKPTSNFITLLEDNNLTPLIYKHCYKDNFILGCNKLGISKEDYSKYQEFWYYTLNIKQK